MVLIYLYSTPTVRNFVLIVAVFPASITVQGFIKTCPVLLEQLFDKLQRLVYP